MDPARKNKEEHGASQCRLDLSNVQYVGRQEDDKEGTLMTLMVATPGVRAADLTVSTVDRYLLIKGESIKGTQTFTINRHILVPHDADMDTISAHHAEGILTLVVRRKVAKRIEVLSPQVADDTEEVAAKHESKSDRAGPVSQPLDEWEDAVPLPCATE